MNPSDDAQKKKAMEEFKRLRASYEEQSDKKNFSALVLGESGSGKSFLARTARGPVHVDSFDPGTGRGLRDCVTSGHIIIDSSFEDEDPMKPTQFALWEKTMERRIKEGYFNFIGTYVLDSSTTWSSAIMNEILRRAGIPGQNPRFTHDYGPQKATINNWLRRLLTLPCDFILTGHLELVKDEVSGKVSWRYMTAGKGSVTIPLLFDEIWVMEPKDSSKGVEYRILTQSAGGHLARSRMAQDGLLSKHEPADIKAALKKAGRNYADITI